MATVITKASPEFRFQKVLNLFCMALIVPNVGFLANSPLGEPHASVKM